MNILRRLWNWQCGFSLSERGLWLIGMAVFAFLLGLVLSSGEWRSGRGLIYNLDYAEVYILGNWIKLKHFAVFSLFVGFAGLTMCFAGRRSSRQ